VEVEYLGRGSIREVREKEERQRRYSNQMIEEFISQRLQSGRQCGWEKAKPERVPSQHDALSAEKAGEVR
jgi:hypothetical protein